MAIVYLSLGSNLGDRTMNLKLAIKHLATSAGEILHESGVYEYKAWGFDSENLFLNMAAGLVTAIEPGDLLDLIKEIEVRMGREYFKEGYSDRAIDIDIIFYNDLILETEKLIIPHPLMHKRKFVLEPLVEIAPGLRHPVLGKTVAGLLSCI